MTAPSHPFPQRQKLPHQIPAWVPEDSRFFITINCRLRGANQLCRDNIAEALLSSVAVYENLGRWYVWLMLIMPDHLHAIASIDRTRGIKPTMNAWKRFHARNLKIDWQDDCFDHRLRSETEFIEKAHYIRLNPVRQNLAQTPNAWPHIFDRTTAQAWGAINP